MQVLIFTEALQSTGLGHFARCTALSEILTEAGLAVKTVLDTDGSVGSSGTNILFRNWKDSQELNDLFSAEGPAIVFIDSYLADYAIFERVQHLASHLVCIDDINRIGYPPGCTILNPGFGGFFIDYDRTMRRIFTGPEYVLLRKPFREEFFIPEMKQDVQSIMITMGAGDIRNLTPAVLRAVTDKLPNARKEVLIGPAFRNIGEIQNVADSNTMLYKDPDARTIQSLMRSVDFAFTAGGQTTYELARCRVPMLILQTIENQMGNIKGWQSIGMNAICFAETEEDQLLDCLDLWDFLSPESRQNQREIFDSVPGFSSASAFGELISTIQQ